MPGGQERILRRRITSVQSTKKITRAMELIAATRVVKAMQRANQARPYAAGITAVIQDLAAAGASSGHPLLRQADDIRTVGFVVVTSDRGLAGPYNSSVIRAAEREIMAAQTEGKDYKLIVIGKKARDYFKFRNYEIAEYFEGMTDSPTYEHAREVAELVADQFMAGEVDQVILTYMEFVSMGTQTVAVRRFLPLESMDVVGQAGDSEARAEFEFEPSPDGVLESLLPRYVESRLFSALLDASASEHANRQRAMKAATDNAEELITKLSRALSRARQDAITTEIMEIVSGAEALGGGEVDDIDAAGLQAILGAGPLARSGAFNKTGPDGAFIAAGFAESGAAGTSPSMRMSASAGASSAGTAVVDSPAGSGASSSGDVAVQGFASAQAASAEPGAGGTGGAGDTGGDAPYGAGSAAPLPDDSAPEGFTIKGNADSMLYHRPDSRSYGVTIAEVWFDTPERAEAAGFKLAGTHPKS